MEKTIVSDSVSQAKREVRHAVMSFSGYESVLVQGQGVVVRVKNRGCVAEREIEAQFPNKTVKGFPITIQEVGEVGAAEEA